MIHEFPALAWKQRPHAHLVSNTRQPLALPVPQHEREIAGKKVDKPFSPLGIGMQAQQRIRNGLGGIAQLSGKACPKFTPRIQSNAPHDPQAVSKAMDGAGLAVGTRRLGAGAKEYDLTHCAQRLDCEVRPRLLQVDRRVVVVEERDEHLQPVCRSS